MKFLTLFLTVVLTLANFAHAKSAMSTFTLQSLRADLLTYGLTDIEYKQRLGEVDSHDAGQEEIVEAVQLYPEELSRPLSRYVGR
jgi:hypothetical protein